MSIVIITIQLTFIPYSDLQSEPKKKCIAYSKDEEEEMKEHLHLQTRLNTPTKAEIENFLKKCTKCKGRTTKSITNKVYYMFNRK